MKTAPTMQPEPPSTDPIYQAVPLLTWQQASRFLGFTGTGRMMFDPGTFTTKKP